MIGFAGKLCAGVAVAAAIGFGAAPAGATTGVPLEPAVVETAKVAPVFAPETGSAGIYNMVMCQLHTISASVPCMYT
ncbi:hypothetical protein ACFQZZ_27095 [Nocardia sp. GCM10030253]|uniref:hypothetical protein n=1 Tax=Nocardia sp. GCM10030253 TaxID=3273404 RepID=UPI00363A63AD